MKNIINKQRLNNIKHILLMKANTVYSVAKKYYQQLNQRQRKILLSSVGVGIMLFLLVILALCHSSHKTTTKMHHPVYFETKLSSIKPSVNLPISKITLPVVKDQHTLEMTSQFNQLKTAASQQYNRLDTQLHAIQSDMAALASQHDIAQLQQAVTHPNHTLLTKVTRLQYTLQKIAKRTTKKMWMTPNTVERYFRLVAVQGFSDGMRAIIDVNGHQTVLSPHEICPACRGWVLQHMDFANQSAVFSKQGNKQTFYVTLRAN